MESTEVTALEGKKNKEITRMVIPFKYTASKIE